MTDSADPLLQLIAALMVVLGLLLFMLGSWRGWWLSWVGGYFVIVAALVLMVFAASGPAAGSAT